MLPVIYDMEIYRGDAFSKRLRFTSDGVPEDLTGKPVLAQIRTSTELTAKLVATFTITRQDTLGVIDISLNPTDTANLKAGEYYYDVQIGDRTRVTGSVTLIPDVSRVA